MSAKNYNEIRRILFCAANNPRQGFSVAYDWMEKTYRRQLDVKSYYGLMAELKFYQQHAREFCLTVAGDMGEHADFAGHFDKQATRFDVTTNLNFKKFKDYEPYMGSGPRYKIALLDQGNFNVIDVFDLAFPKCDSCGWHLIPAVILLSQNHNRHGESLGTNDQLLIDVCTGCNEYIERKRFTHHGIMSPQEHFYAVSDDAEDDDKKLTEQHIVSTYKYFRRQHSDYLMAVGSHDYFITEPDGGGYWAINFDFVNSAVANNMPCEIECSHEI